MSEKKEQEKPLAPSTRRVDPESNEIDPPKPNGLKCVKCLGCSTAIFLLLAMLALILTFTVFRTKDPILKMNSATVEGLGSTLRSNGSHATLTVDFSIKNPNVGTFKFNGTSTFVYYEGSTVGEARTPADLIRARKTVGMKASIELKVDKILQSPRFKEDGSTHGILPITSETMVIGKVRIGRAIKRHVAMRMKCDMNVSVSSNEIRDRNCRSRVSS